MSAQIDRVTQPPPHPLMVWDGDCHFCGMWIRRWRPLTGDAVDYSPYQEVRGRFAELTEKDYAQAVHLILPDGRVRRGAEAVFECLDYAPQGGTALFLYRRVPGVAPVCRGLYRLIARHRMTASLLTRFFWGDPGTPSTYRLSGMLFTRLVGLVFLIAFVSFWSQAPGLVGDRGIVPLKEYFDGIRNAPDFTPEQRFWVAPSLLWLMPDNQGLEILLTTGTACSVLAMAGLAPGWALLGCVLAYGSLCNGVPIFLHYQWDALLVETGLVTLLVAPWNWRLRWGNAPEPPRAGRWLAWWLLFKLMFLSGLVKIITNASPLAPAHPGWFRRVLSKITDVPIGENTWLDGTALQYHYFTQPIPAWTSWYFAHLPAWFQSGSLWTCMFIELVVPFAFFGPRRLRHLAAALEIALQIVLLASGNYGFFNVLTIVLCVPLLDDTVWPRRLRQFLAQTAGSARPVSAPRKSRVRAGFIARRLVAALIFLIGLTQIREAWDNRSREMAMPRPPNFLDTLSMRAQVLGLVNSYGLFRVMTTERPELIFEGSLDGQDWKTYEFKWKPGDVLRAPAFTTPNMPRLDWQLWFAALDVYYSHRLPPWVQLFAERLQQNDPAVLALLANNPFPGAPPKQIRIHVYTYKFTTPEERARTGAWWTRTQVL